MSLSRYGEDILKKNIHFPLIIMIHKYIQEPLTNDTLIDAIKKYETKEIINRYGKISDWDVSKVTDMSDAFEYNEKFNQPLGDSLSQLKNLKIL